MSTFQVTTITYSYVRQDYIFETDEPIVWISTTIIGLFAMIVTLTILIKECRIRKHKQITFSIKNASIWSLLCIIGGVVQGFSLFTRRFNYFCYFSRQINATSATIQGICMGIYQLDRLHFCFSQSNVHSAKGYPNWLFVIMYCWGILLLITVSIWPWFYVNKYEYFCGIDFTNYTVTIHYSQFYIQLLNYSTILGLSWDFVTLLLYVIKKISFQKYKRVMDKKKGSINYNYNRIMATLNRIIILTILYEIPFFIAALIMTFWKNVYTLNICYSLFPITQNLSMYLMQEHNTQQYRAFLRTVNKMICCKKMKQIIDVQLDAMSAIPAPTNSSEVGVKEEHNNNPSTHDTINETHGITQTVGINVNPFELSVPTSIALTMTEK